MTGVFSVTVPLGATETKFVEEAPLAQCPVGGARPAATAGEVYHLLWMSRPDTTLSSQGIA